MTDSQTDSQNESQAGSQAKRQNNLPVKVTAKTIFTHPVHFLAFGFGSGLAPKAPGTFGTIACIPLYLLIADQPLINYLMICALVVLAGVYICGQSARLLNTHDHPGIVWDEFAGLLITYIGFTASWQNVLLGFCLFRLFDIFKPWPIKWVDRHVHGGFGIMLDDILAGALAWAGLFIFNLTVFNGGVLNSGVFNNGIFQ